MKNQSSANRKVNVSFGKRQPQTVRWGLCSYDKIPLLVGVTEEGAVCRVAFANGLPPLKVVQDWSKAWKRTAFIRDHKAVAPAAKAILEGNSQPLMMVGTEFQCDVWKNLLAIPAGTVVSYAELARRSKRPKAVRAAGTACGANPVAILVPCHRVIGSNGGLGGFGGGLEVKKKLLKKEGIEKKGMREKGEDNSPLNP